MIAARRVALDHRLFAPQQQLELLVHAVLRRRRRAEEASGSLPQPAKRVFDASGDELDDDEDGAR